jgi:signal transduction histidine kinase
MRHSAFMRLAVGLALTFIIVLSMIFAVVYFVMAGNVEDARKAGDAVPNLAPAGDLFLHNLFAILLGAALASAVIAAIGSAFLSRWLVSRIVEVNTVAAAVREGNLAARVPGADKPDEFGELAANVNSMLDRIERLVAGMRDVSDRIAHELRTPLTRLRAQVQKLNAVPPGSAEAAHARAAISDEIGTTVAIFDALLDIATTEAEAGDQTRLKIVDLAEVIASVVDLYDAVAEERGIALSVDAKGPAEMLGDGGLLTRMLANVVDNAIKFSPAGGRVAITLATEGRSHILTVADSGPGLSPDIRDRAFERFARGASTASVPGHGLGLAVVKAIAVRHGIGISLKDAKPGLAVVFTCPALTSG